jgi:SAM-dependent methyltransferase
MSNSTISVDDARPALDLFEGFAVSSVLAALEMSGDLSVLAAGGIDTESDPRRDKRERDLLSASLRYLEQRGLVHNGAGRFALTSYGEAVYRDRGFLLWLVGGYGEPLRQLDAMLGLGKRYGTDCARDGRWVADGTTLMAKRFVIPDAMALLGRLSFASVLDLGCGNARFLMGVCRTFGARGVGVDVSPAAYAEAEKAVSEAGLERQIELVLSDVRTLDNVPGLDEIQLVVAFYLLHEFLAISRQAVTSFLADLARRLPPKANLVIGEVEPPPAGRVGSVFTPEFSYIHAMMGQRLLSADEWADVLADGGFSVREVVRLNFPGAILLCCERR